MEVQVYCINKGTNTEYYGLKNAAENTILHFAPNNSGSGGNFKERSGGKSTMNEYGKYYPEIEKICKQYGFTKCEKCPLYSACQTERKDGETQGEYTERWETAVTEAYKKVLEEKSE